MHVCFTLIYLYSALKKKFLSYVMMQFHHILQSDRTTQMSQIVELQKESS